MNKNALILCSLAIWLPLTAMAEGLDLEEELNGLDIEAELVGSSGGGSAGTATVSTTQMLQITNNADVSVTCELQPGPAEAQSDAPPPTTIEPGEQTSLAVPGKYTGAPLQAKLVCEPQ
ncbi:hypothetical protein [Stutzerimonas kunmingensis]|uniref:hypothetical protein n=1 Tax=Stutzerimonas kunmingensis TaxID=1211807 RepID=UPI0028B0848A|nr:hypothetical protein [Stutzerimonas kunmingensis]